MTSDGKLTARRRVFAGAALLLVVVLGLASRRFPLGQAWWDKSLGDVLYAAAVYSLLTLVRPHLTVGRVAAVALAFCVAVELFQLTGIPGRYAYLPPVRWILGTRFAWHDLVCYGIGIAVIALLDRLMARSRYSAAS